jgi:hypothetical protein
MRFGVALVSAIAASLLFVSSGFCETGNLLHNGGFEKESAGSVAAGWSTKVFRNTNVEMALDRETRHDGAASFRASFDEEGGRAMLYPNDDISGVIPGRDYTVSLWVKARNLDYAANFVAPALQFNFSPNKITPYPVIDFMEKMKGEDDWRQLSLTCTAPEGTKAAEINIILTAGTIWLDDISVRPASAD